MKVYLISDEKINGLDALNNITIENFNYLNYSEDNPYKLKNDIESTVINRGYPLSPFELSIYYRHYSVWKEFAESNEEYALVLENVTAIHLDGDDLNDIVTSFQPEWDIVFLFNGFNANKQENPSFMLGFRWGKNAYFINKKCIPKLVDIKALSLPIDEQLLFLNRKGLIQIQYEDVESNILSFGNDNIYNEGCNNSKLIQILRTNLWSREDRILMRFLLKDLSELFAEINLPFFISEGTLLGYVRHKEVISWDDDVDISISSSDTETMIRAINSTEKYRVTKWFWGKNRIEYYKVSHKDSTHVRNLPYGFPFIDIWIYEVYNDHVKYNHGFKIPLDFIFPLGKAMFENTQIGIPNSPTKYLDLKYKDWKEKITVYRWCHKHEIASLFPLSANISVDNNGLIYKPFQK